MPPTSRVPYVWGDTLGTVGMVLNQEKGVPEPGEPMSPGMSPTTQHFIMRYTPYMSLTEWESLKSNLKEEMPCKRDTLADYFPQQQVPSRSSRADASVAQEAMVSAPPSVAASGPASEGRGAAQRPAAQAASSARSNDSPKVVVVSNAERELAALLTPAPTTVAGRMIARPSPRAEPQKLQQEEARPLLVEYVAGPAPEPEHPALRFKLSDGLSTHEEVPMKVSQVKANAVAGNGRQQPERKARVADKDKAQYGNGRHMKPAREMNLSSKKRLNELLKLPAMKIEAGDEHASRSYSVIPAQNLRVV